MRSISPSGRLPFHTVVLGVAITALSAGDAGVTAGAHRAAAASHERALSTDPAVTRALGATVQLPEHYGKLPLSFAANHGQSDANVRFLARGNGYTLFLTSNEAVLVLSRSESAERPKASRVTRTPIRARTRESPVVRMTLVNANPQSRAAGRDELPGKSNYFIGDDRTKWRTNIPTYAKVRYEGVYPGVDLVYYGTQGQLEFDFVVAPGADPGAITLAFEGSRDVRVDARGHVVIGIEGGEVRSQKPLVYQEVAGVKQEVAGRYVTKGTRRVGFRVTAYDPSRPLIIDPVLVYSTYLGGSGQESGQSIALDDAGNAYVTGSTNSIDFPTTAGAVQMANGGSTDVFVTKLDATGSALVYSTYLGGLSPFGVSDSGSGIAVDGVGSAYVTGLTSAANFPTTAGAVQRTLAGEYDVFVAKLDATGSVLVYSTYLGGSSFDSGRGIAVDGTGSAYVTGNTFSPDFPTTAGVAQTTYSGDGDAFVTRVDARGSGLVFSTYLGAGGNDAGFGVAVDGAGSAYVAGPTYSSDFPTTAGAAQTTFTGEADAFVAKLNATGSGLLYSTYLGGSRGDFGLPGVSQGYGIAVDGAGNAYVTGLTDSIDFPTTPGAAQTTFGGGDFYDAFVTKLDATGSVLVYSTYLGGGGHEIGYSIAVDGRGSAYVTGLTGSTDFPTTAEATQTTYAGDLDAFVAKLDATGARWVYSTYLGGRGDDGAGGIATDSVGAAYVTGGTRSANFPTTPGAAQTINAGDFDAFVVRIATLPTSIDECRDGGWKTFGVFKNQGDCASFVKSKGKNPPSGP